MIIKKIAIVLAILFGVALAYSYAYANAVVIVLGDDFFVIPIGAKAKPSQSVSYEYDALGRLVEVDTVGGPTQTYDLDDAGNRTVIRIF